MFNKNIIKKTLSILLLFVLFGNTVATYAIQLKVKLDSGASYSTTVEVTNNSSVLSFEIFIPMLTTGNYSITLPTGLEKIDVDGATSCDQGKILSHSNTYFSFTADGQFCKYYLNYNVSESTTSGEYPISVLNIGTGIPDQQITVTVTDSNLITKAETLDTNSNGYIDQYKLTFSTGGLSGFSNTNLTVGTETPTLDSISTNIVYINFTDSIYTTGDKPQIIDTDGGIFTGIPIIDTNTITEEDKAEPIITDINGTEVVGVASPSINLSQNDKLTITFSERIYSNSLTSSFIIKEDNIDITNSSYITFNESDGSIMYYCLGGYDGGGDCNTSFDSNKSYTIEVGNSMIDLNSNIYTGGTVNVTISIEDITPPVSSSVIYNSETNDAIVINGNASSNDYTNNAVGTVSLDIGADDNSGVVSQMCISEISEASNCDTGWKTYSTSDSFTFTGTEGINTLYIKFKDAAGNISSVFSDSIVWDKTTPTSSATPNGGSFINGFQIVTLECSDSISSCPLIYYTIDGSAPTTSSTGVISGTDIVLSGTDQTITLKYFTKDIADNQEGLTNSKDFVFSNSYVTFTNPITITDNSSLTLTGTCNNASGVNDAEYSLNGGTYSNVMTDTCDDSNTWSTDLTLLTNQINTIDTRIKANTGVTTNISVKHDNISPSSLSLSIDGGDAYSNSTSVNLTISASDTNGTDQMCITESIITNDNICTGSSWENYSNSKGLVISATEGTKTVYIKFKDAIGNISSVINDTIVLETTPPTVSANISSGNYRGSKSVTLSSSNNIYYTTDGNNPTNLSTLYTSAFSFGSSISTVNLKAIAYGDSGLAGTVKSYTYDFGCFAVSNGNVSQNYPTCTVTCNNGYELSGRSCVEIPSSGGGGGSGGPGAMTDFENVKYISKTKIALTEQIVSKIHRVYGILDIQNFSSEKLTGENGSIEIKTSSKGFSKLTISENTSIMGDAKLIYAPHSFEVKGDLKVPTLKINNKDLPSYNIKKVFFAGNTETPVSFNKEVGIKFNMGDEIEGKVYVYHSNVADGNFSLIKTGLTTDEDGFISFNTNNLGYFAFVRDIYVSRYFGTQTVTVKNINTKTSTEALITSLKSQISNPSVIALIDLYAKALIIPEMDYYVSFDSELQSKYNAIIKGYTDFIVNTDKYLTTKESQYQTLAANGYKEYIKIKELKNFDKKYVIKTNRDGLEIYKTTYISIAHLVDALENVMLIKLQKLLDANTINQAKYDQTIKDYNDFILHLSIYRQYKIKAAAYKALIPGRAFLKVYKMKVVYKTTETTIIEKPVVNKILIKNKYNFPTELRFGNYNQYVKNLQEIMKLYGYFTYPTTTQYFGNVTQTSFLNFERDILKNNTPKGVLTKELIEKLYLLEYKN